MLYAENLTNLLTVAGIVIGCVTAIYIAYKQGVFQKTYLLVSCGKPFVDEKPEKWIRKHVLRSKKPLWAVCFGVPDTDVDSYLLFIPFLIKNNSGIAVKNIHIQLSTRQEFDPSPLKINDSDKYNAHVLGIKGHFTTWQGKLQFECTVPILSPQSHLTVYLPIALDKSLFKKNKDDFANKILSNSIKNEFVIDEINCYFSAESCKPKEFKTYLLIAFLKSSEELKKKTESPLLNLHELDCPNLFRGRSGLVFKPAPWPLWYSLMFPKCRKKKPFLLAQSSYSRMEFDKKVLVEDFENTLYVPALLVFNQ
mgnify:CR=1 FL=1